MPQTTYRTVGAQRRRLISCLRLIRQRREAEIEYKGVPFSVWESVGLDPYEMWRKEVAGE